MLLRLYVVLQRALDQRFSPREHETYLDYPVWAIFTRPFFKNSSGTTSRYTGRTSHAASATSNERLRRKARSWMRGGIALQNNSRHSTTSRRRSTNKTNRSTISRNYCKPCRPRSTRRCRARRDSATSVRCPAADRRWTQNGSLLRVRLIDRRTNGAALSTPVQCGYARSLFRRSEIAMGRSPS